MHPTAAMLLLALLLPSGSPTPEEAYRADLAALARDGSWWVASNAEHAEEEGIDAYGTRYWVEPGGLSSVGCLWSERDGEVVGVHWRFFQGWDGVEGRPLYYQTHTDGTITGFGRETWREGRAQAIEQTFRWSDGTLQRIAHRSEWTDDDTRVTESFALAEGRWRANRTYTWERRTSGAEPPCGP